MEDETKIWSYNRGVWEEVPSPLTPPLFDCDEDARRAGYERADTLGWPADGMSLDIYSRREAPCFYGIFTPGERMGWDFVCPDQPSLFLFLRDYAPMLHAQSATNFLFKLETSLARAFEAWHGHSLDTFCSKCDRVEDGLAQERRRRREQEARRTEKRE
jgi:hypothetical protein